MFWNSIVLVLVLVASNSLAGSSAPCPEYNLNAPGGSLEHVPVHDQIAFTHDSNLPTDLALCYAIQAVQLIDAFRFSSGDQQFDHLTAVMQVAAAQSNRSRYKTPLDGGDPALALKLALQQGSCDARSFKLSNEDLSKTKDLLTYYFLITSDAKELLEEKERIRQRVGCIFLKANAFEQTEKLIGQVNHAFSAMNQSGFFDSLTQSVCDSHWVDLKPFKIRPNSVPFKNRTLQFKLSALASAQNQSPKQPIGIDINILDPSESSDANHAMIVAGQRLSGNRCQLLLRDSVGIENCRTDYYKRFKPEKDCVAGHMWVDRDLVLGAVSQITWLSKNPSHR